MDLYWWSGTSKTPVKDSIGENRTRLDIWYVNEAHTLLRVDENQSPNLDIRIEQKLRLEKMTMKEFCEKHKMDASTIDSDP